MVDLLIEIWDLLHITLPPGEYTWPFWVLLLPLVPSSRKSHPDGILLASTESSAADPAVLAIFPNGRSCAAVASHGGGVLYKCSFCSGFVADCETLSLLLPRCPQRGRVRLLLTAECSLSPN